MKMFLIGALCAWFLVSFIETSTHICGVLEFPMELLTTIIAILVSPFIFLYRIFLRHTIKPVDSEAIQRAKIMEDSKHLFGSIYICFDKKAKRFANKVFLFRVLPVETSDILDSPENFRIGVDK